jgi:hypothetical protein
MHCLWQSKLTQPHWQTFCQEWSNAILLLTMYPKQRSSDTHTQIWLKWCSSQGCTWTKCSG